LRARLAGARPALLALAGALAAVAILGRLAAARAAGGEGGAGWARVHRENLVVEVPVSGTLAAVDAAHLGPPVVQNLWQFKITFMAPEGAQVRRGQPVLAFDASELAKILRDKEAERDSAQQKLAKRRADMEIARHDDQLHLAEAAADHRRAELKLAVPAELKRRNELADARADEQLAARAMAYYQERLRLQAAAGAAEMQALAGQRDRAAARVGEVRTAIASMRLTAPRDGTVIYVADRRGAKKKIGDSVWRQEKPVEIPDLRRLEAAGEIDEADAGRVAAGQRVVLRLDAHPEVSFAGRVRAVKAAVEARSPDSPVKVVRLAIDLERTDPQRMRPGMRFAGAVEVQRTPAVLVAPLDAVISRPDGPLVYRRAGFGVEPVRPRLGRHNELWVEVLSGLRAGDLLRRSRDEGPPAAAAPSAPSSPASSSDPPAPRAGT
jgi:HlyD family secretion protein